MPLLKKIIYLVPRNGIGDQIEEHIDTLPIGYTFFNFICLAIYFGLSFYTLTRIIKLVTKLAP